VNAYFAGLSTANTPAKGYNSRGRGYPDISLVAVQYHVVVSNYLFSLYGTSCSAPVMAAFGRCELLIERFNVADAGVTVRVLSACSFFA
jgi:hypothetical protein